MWGAGGAFLFGLGGAILIASVAASHGLSASSEPELFAAEPWAASSRDVTNAESIEPTRVASLTSIGAMDDRRERTPSDSELGLVEVPTPLPASPSELAASSGSELSLEPEAESWLGVTTKELLIRARPDPQAEVLGAARMGALLRRAAAKPSATSWHAVRPRGYVFGPAGATLDLEHPVLKLASREADRSEALPYRYGRSRLPTPAFYTRVPTSSEQATVELDLTRHRAKNFGHLWTDVALGPPPGPLLDGKSIPGRPEGAIATGYARPRSTFAFLDLFESGGRPFGLTTDFSVIALDRLEPVRASEFRGVILTPELGLPLVFVKNRSTWVYQKDERSGALRPTRRATYREAFHVEPELASLGGGRFYRTRGDEYLRESTDLVLIRELERLPKWAVRGSAPWLSVSLLRQTLVAFRGSVPIFATLVSTGVGGTADPSETHATVQGVFRIHTKHITKTMTGNEADDPYDLRDVPYVQYFHEGYALHAAFWHDSFGQPRSHGCINLSPSDARHIFHGTEPAVPEGWHSALSRKGTILWVHE